MEIRIGGANLSNAMLAHERSNMKVVHRVAGRVRILTREITDDFWMPVRFYQQAKGQRRKQAFDELICLGEC